uniref:Uncharacterized protein n=1 Tax=Rhizophora mucronata TaxID=61149 RepID=A0A2P2MB75_RHIMU
MRDFSMSFSLEMEDN